MNPSTRYVPIQFPWLLTEHGLFAVRHKACFTIGEQAQAMTNIINTQAAAQGVKPTQQQTQTVCGSAEDAAYYP